MNTPQLIHATHIASGDLWAGAETQLFTLCKKLNNRNDTTVNIILLNHGTLEEKLVEENIPVVVFDEKKLNGLQIGKRIYNTLKQERPNIVHTHRLKENILGGITAWLNNIPSVRTVHGAAEHNFGWKKPHKTLLHFLDRFVGRYIQSKLIAVSHDLSDTLILSYPPTKITVIENGIDIDFLTPFSKKADNSSSDIKTNFKIGLVGRLVPVKRADQFIRAAKLINDNCTEFSVSYHIYGDGPLRKELEGLVKKLGIGGIVHFEGHCNTIHSQIASLDILVITSDHEGLPMTLLEAIAVKTHVIANAVGGIKKVCKEGMYCHLIPNNYEKSIAEKIISCMNEFKQAPEILDKAYNHIKRNYSAEANAIKVRNLYLSHLLNTRI